MAQQSKSQLEATNQSNFPNNNTGFITPTRLRGFNTDIIDSMVDENSYNIDSSSLSGSVESLQAQINALVLSGSGVQIEDNGVVQGVATTLDFNGGIQVVVAAGKADISVDSSVITTAVFTPFSSSVVTQLNSVSGITASFDAYTGSNDARVQALETETGSLQSQIDNLELFTGSYATTGSNTFVGNQNVLGSFTASLSEGYAWVG